MSAAHQKHFQIGERHKKIISYLLSLYIHPYISLDIYRIHKIVLAIFENFLTTKHPHIADRFCVDFNAYLIIPFKSISENFLTTSPNPLDFGDIYNIL